MDRLLQLVLENRLYLLHRLHRFDLARLLAPQFPEDRPLLLLLYFLLPPQRLYFLLLQQDLAPLLHLCFQSAPGFLYFLLRPLRQQLLSDLAYLLPPCFL